MIRTIALILLALALPTHAAQALSSYRWGHRFGDTGFDNGYSVAVDAASNVYVTGWFEGTVDFGGGNLVSAGSDDIFLAKFNKDGVHQWSYRFGDVGSDQGASVALDASANVFLTGYFTGTVDFGGAPLTSVSDDAFLAKFDTDGNHLWSKNFAGPGNEYGNGVAVDGSGNPVIAGTFDNTISFGTGPFPTNGGADVFVAGFDAAGGYLWSKRWGGAGYEQPFGVAVDSQGAVVVTGEFQGAADFGSFNQGDLISNGEDDVFVAKHIPGFITLTDTFGGIGADFGLGVAIDASDNIVITGSFQNQLNFHGQGHASHGSNDIFLAEYDPQLAPVWSKWVGGTGNDQGAGIATDPAGQVIVTGWCQGSVDLGGGIFASISAYDDAFVARYDATGAYVISRHFGGSGPDSAGGYGIAADGTDALVVTGAFFGTVDFGGGALVSAGADDVFVAKYGADLAAPVLSTPGAQTLSISSFPNPFNPRTMLTYTVPSRGAVNVSIFDTRGARVATLVRNETREAGAYQVGWDGRDDNGAVVSSGVYFARIEHAGATSVRKVVLLK